MSTTGGIPLVRLAGYGSSSDGHKITACHPRGAGLRRAMEAAIAGSGIDRTQIGYVNAHGTSTRLNDQAEIRAIVDLFADHARQLKVNATKSMIGHCVVAAGAVAAVVTVLSLRSGRVHPTRNLRNPDTGCELDYCAGGAGRIELPAALSNSCGFSGGNSSLLFARGPEEET